MARFEFDSDWMMRTLVDLLNTPSPTGDTEYAVSLVESTLAELNVASHRTKKGALVATLPGLDGLKKRAITAHLDTLGAIVVQIKPSGRLKLKALNALMWPTVESEGVTIATRGGRLVRGSLVLVNGADHVNKDANTTPRNADTLEVRLDERTHSAEETRLLGIEVGDIVSFDPRVETGAAGFIRSRFLDDKACVACGLAAIKVLQDNQLKPSYDTEFLFSVSEETGVGGIDGLARDLDELLVLDMACVGEGVSGNEFHCSVCIADSRGPYSRRLTGRVRDLAEERGIDLIADVYPFYSSDGSAYWIAGGEAEVALIGPGVDTSHGYERTHLDALKDTAELVAEYLVED